MSTLILGCRPTLPNVEAEVKAIAATAPGAELFLDPTAAQAGQRAPHHTWCHFAGHADPKLGPDRVLVLCHNGGFSAVDASTLVDMLRTMKLVVLNGCKSEELGLKLREAGVPNVVVWKTTLYDPAAMLFAVRFWEVIAARSPNDHHSLRTAVRAAFEAAKVAVQTAVRPGGAIDVGGGRRRAAAVPAYELHDPQDAATVEQQGPNRGKLLPAAGAEKAGRNAAGVPLLLQQPATVHGVPPRPDHYEPRPDVEGSVRKALLGAPQDTLAITPTGLCGTAGLGKTTLATWLALDAEVQSFFADGVFWLRFGQEATALAKLQELAGALGMPLDDSRMRDVQPAVAALQARLSGAGTHHLVILDDVWVKEQVSPFKQLCNGGTVGLVLTTRLKELAQRFGQPQALEPLDEVRARSMLARCLQRPEAELEADDDFRKLLRRSCGLPIMLESLANMCSGQTPGDVLRELEAARAEMEKLEVPGGGDYEHEDFFGGLEVQLRRLEEKEPELAYRYAMLAVLPEDVQMPLVVAQQLWGASESQTRATARKLAEQHLLKLESRNDDTQVLSLLDLHLQYLRHRGRNSLRGWHAGLLQRCGRRKLGEREEREDDSYWYTSRSGAGLNVVVHHLKGSEWTGLSTEVVTLSLQISFLGAEDAAAIADILKVNGVLTELKLCNNEIGDTGAASIAEALKVNGTMTALNLMSNKIGAAGAAAIAEALKVNRKLQSLVLLGNHLNEDSKSKLRDAVQGRSGFKLYFEAVPTEPGSDSGFCQPMEEGLSVDEWKIRTKRSIRCDACRRDVGTWLVVTDAGEDFCTLCAGALVDAGDARLKGAHKRSFESRMREYMGRRN